MPRIVKVTGATPRRGSAGVMATRQATRLSGYVAGGPLPDRPLPLAFPGAEGAGRGAIGGRKGDSYAVTNLNDSGPGSFRDAVDTTPASGRLIQFACSGTIPLKSAIFLKSYTTLDGSSAPRDGICTRNYTVNAVDVEHIIVRHMRFRVGDLFGGDFDSFQIVRSRHIILDHCSFSWGIDENVSPWQSSNITIQWCISSEALMDSAHSKGTHSKGLIGSHGPTTVHHCLFAHNDDRNPHFYGQCDVINNIIFNWDAKGTTLGTNPTDAGEPGTFANYMSNYYIAGLSTDGVDSLFFRGWAEATIYEDGGNFVDFDVNGSLDGAAETTFLGGYTPSAAAMDFGYPLPATDTATEAYSRVLADAGATLPKRDIVDAQMVADVQAEEGLVIDSQTASQSGGWPF